MSPGWDPSNPVVEVRSPRVGIPADGGGSNGRNADDGAARLDLPGTRVAIPPSGRLLVVGPNGTGKSTLLAALAGTLELDRGSRMLAPGARIGVVGQESEPIRGKARLKTGFETYADEALRLLASNELDPDHVVPVAGLGLLSEEDLDRPLAELSAGQRRRFELARALLHAPHLLLLDEPTNHLSIDLVDELTRALQVTPCAVVVATHDLRMRADLEDWPVLDLTSTT